MREELGFEVIKKPTPYLSLYHEEHISGHGEGNERKLTGKHETAKIDPVSLGVTNCGCSIYEDCDTKKPGKGHLKDGVLPQTWASMLCLVTARDYTFMGARPKVEALAVKKLALKV